MTYTDLWEIIEYAQKGSGYTRSTRTTLAKKVLDSLAKKGWTKAYLQDVLYNLDDHLLTGWPEELFQESYMKETAEVLDTLELSLLKRGVKPAKVQETLAVIAPLENTCYTQKQLLDVALEYILGKYKPIAHPDATHFIQPEERNVWIPYESKEIMNVSYACDYSTLPRFEKHINTTFPQRNGKVYYHATNWRGAVNILKRIDYTKGRTCLDFGLTPAFYVSESAYDAVDWGVKNGKKWKNEIAIVAFYIPNSFHYDFKVKDLRHDPKEWEWVVTSFRDCIDKDDVNKYNYTYDFIYGPMLANPEYYKTEGPRLHRPPVMQLAAKNDFATKYLYECMKGAFIFRKPNKPV